MNVAGTASEVVVVTSAERKQTALEPGLTRLVGSYNEKLFLAEHYMEQAGLARPTAMPMSRLFV